MPVKQFINKLKWQVINVSINEPNKIVAVNLIPNNSYNILSHWLKEKNVN